MPRKQPPKKSEDLGHAISQQERERTPDLDWVTPAEEWAEFRKYKSFRLPNSDSQYQVGEFVYIYPEPPKSEKAAKRAKKAREPSPDDEANDPDSDPWWIGYITDIKARDERTVFMKVEWLYTTVAQLKEAGVKNVPARIEGHEVFRSPWSDILPVHAVEDRAPIVEFDETNPIQEPIADGTVWYRSEICTKAETAATKTSKKRKRPSVTMAKRRTEPTLVIRPLHPPTCLCNKPYVPIPYEEGTMVYCPSESCGKWFHTACLEQAKKTIDKPTTEQLETMLTHGSDSLSRFDRTIDPLPVPEGDKEIDRLSKIAIQSILRGTISTGLVGNGREVLLAREALSSGDKPTVPPKEGRDKVWKCPDCAEAI